MMASVQRDTGFATSYPLPGCTSKSGVSWRNRRLAPHSDRTLAAGATKQRAAGDFHLNSVDWTDRAPRTLTAP